MSGHTNSAWKGCAHSFARSTARHQKRAQKPCNKRAPIAGKWRAWSPRSQPCTWKWGTGP